MALLEKLVYFSPLCFRAT